MNYSPKQGTRSHGLPHDPFKSSTIPRPIGWISTTSKDGNDNLAPYSQYQNLTWDPVSTVDLVIGRVAQVHIKDEVILENGKLDIKSIRPIARLGYYDYTVVDEIFEMKAPAATKEELAGLEGRNFDNKS
ncbi:hypothetical protein CD144_04285 [Staphylococcus equorum subsp. linens]|uniref:hypothetical protein n=1 Tax=Staphylococcus equorum TaxID=246432 RepID=UPI000CD0153C|nr:hypothetical protein [Staphylococcus equorum]PNZ08488.1 hypothetical protein CD144_04285 [Staphylococcus equorum subsp. linens]QQT17489.1 hypothetical protein I6J07_11680 [Staphylococcus equorum]